MKIVNLIKIFIASPGDVGKQRDEIEKIIWDWNNEHSDAKNTVLMPIRWENNSIASYRENSDGQAVINEQIVTSSDILIAIFWSKIGTRTLNGVSGTVEEINVFFNTHKKGIGIFFVNEPVLDRQIKDREIVLKYQEHLRKDNKGLYAEYEANVIRKFITAEVDKLIKESSGDNTHPFGNQVLFDWENIFNDFFFDKDEMLLMIYIVEDSRQEFGARWMAQTTISEIKRWEQGNNLSPYLSGRYEETLNKIFKKGLFFYKRNYGVW